MDIEKTMQFLLAQQARFDARQAESEERMAQIEAVMLEVARAQERTNAILATLTERHIELEQSQQSLYHAQRATEQSQQSLYDAHRATEQSQQSLYEAQRATEQNLNALSAIVERHILNHD